MSKGTIKKVAGPLVIAQGMRDANMFDVCRVSDQRLIGEIIEIHGDQASVHLSFKVENSFLNSSTIEAKICENRPFCGSSAVSFSVKNRFIKQL